MSNPDRPRSPLAVQPAEIQVAARIDRKILEWLQLTGRCVHREAFGDGTKVKDQRAAEGNGALLDIDVHVTIGDIAFDRDGRADGASTTLLSIEPSHFHAAANRWIERAARILRDAQGEPNRLKEHRTCRDRLSHARRQLHQLAVLVEPRTSRLNLAKPVERSIDRSV